MNYLVLATIAYLLNAVAITIDKILLVKRLPNPALYVFYISVFSLIVFFGIPFATFPDQWAFINGSISTILWTLGAYFMFKALKDGEAVRVVPIIGTLIPLILFAMAAVSDTINLNEIWAVVFLLIGLIFLILPYLKGKFSKVEIYYEIISALLFANSYFLLKVAYDTSNFLSVMVYSRVVLVPILLAILIIPFLRKKVFSSDSPREKINLWSKTGFILLIGQACGGFSGLLLTFSISLANPAVINSIQGIQYVFLFILGLTVAKKFPAAFNEKLTKSHFGAKIIGIIFIFFGLGILSYSAQPIPIQERGLTFSPRYANELGLPAMETYNQVLHDLQPDLIRLPIYWDEVEKNPGEYNFSEIEEMVKMAEIGGSDIILTLGFKQPRWPECFAPQWAKELSKDQFDQRILDLVQKEIETFKKYPNIKYWQVENEPLVEFGKCPLPDKQRLIQEIEIVKNQDNRPVMITDSGELSSWFSTAGLGDVFGTTLYRNVWSPLLVRPFTYPWPPFFYTLKYELAKLINHTKNPSMISELQAEPWPADAKSIPEVNLSKQIELFPVRNLDKNLMYAEQAKMGPIIFWGAEWWYYMKDKGNDAYVQKAKEIFN